MSDEYLLRQAQRSLIPFFHELARTLNQRGHSETESAISAGACWILYHDFRTLHCVMETCEIVSCRLRASNPSTLGGCEALRVVCLGLLLAGGCDSGGAETLATIDDSPNYVLTVRVFQADSESSRSRTVIVYGELTAQKKRDLRFGGAGKVKTVLKRSGESVQLNEQLATLEQPALEEKRLALSRTLKAEEDKLPEDAAADREQRRRRIQQLRGQLHGLEAEIAKGILLSPGEGVVAAVNIEEGMFALPDLVAMQIVEKGPPTVVANVPEAFGSILKSRDEVLVHLDNEFVSAKVQSRRPLLGPVTGQIVSFAFDNDPPPASWSYGDVVEVRMTASSDEHGIWLPFSSLLRDADAKWAVYTVASETGGGDGTGRVERQDVNILRLENGMALVEASTLGESVIILEGTHRVVPGQVVTPVLTSKVMSKPSGRSE